MNKEFIDELKSIKLPKEKKWMVNMCVAMIKEAEKPQPDRQKANMIINRYYLQHYKNYYTEIYKNKPKKEREKYIEKQVKNPKMNERNKKLGANIRKIYKLYQEGKLSKHSSQKIFEETGE